MRKPLSTGAEWTIELIARYDQAIATIDRLQAETSTKDPAIAGLKGNVLLRLERYPEAIAVLRPLAEAADIPVSMTTGPD